jgi:hypothetical protein
MFRIDIVHCRRITRSRTNSAFALLLRYITDDAEAAPDNNGEPAGVVISKRHGW